MTDQLDIPGVKHLEGAPLLMDFYGLEVKVKIKITGDSKEMQVGVGKMYYHTS